MFVQVLEIEIGIGCIGLSASWRQPWSCTLLNVVEHLANEARNCPPLERAECDVYFEHALQWSVTRRCA